jgi:hypothetical protein
MPSWGSAMKKSPVGGSQADGSYAIAMPDHLEPSASPRAPSAFLRGDLPFVATGRLWPGARRRGRILG